MTKINIFVKHRLRFRYGRQELIGKCCSILLFSESFSWPNSAAIFLNIDVGFSMTKKHTWAQYCVDVSAVVYALLQMTTTALVIRA